MRVIRSVVKPANISLCRQFQLRQFTKASNIQWRARSNAASVPSDEPKKLTRRKYSKQERRSMLQNYVNKYRAVNAGKFPTTTEAQKDVGGSYYVVRQILQELKYNFEMSPIDTRDAISLKKGDVKNDEISTNFGEVSQSQELGEVINNGKASTCVNSFSSRKSRSDADSVECGQIQTDSSDGGKDGLHSHPETDAKQESTSEDNIKFDVLPPKAEQQHSTESEISERELHKVPTEDSPQRKLSLWQNLKSFAGGIFGRWRT